MELQGKREELQTLGGSAKEQAELQALGTNGKVNFTDKYSIQEANRRCPVTFILIPFLVLRQFVFNRFVM